MEILPQEELKQPKGLKILFYFGLAFLFFSIVGFFILNHFLEEAQKERSTLEVTIKERLTPEKLKIKEMKLIKILILMKKVDANLLNMIIH